MTEDMHCQTSRLVKYVEVTLGGTLTNCLLIFYCSIDRNLLVPHNEWCHFHVSQLISSFIQVSFVHENIVVLSKAVLYFDHLAEVRCENDQIRGFVALLKEVSDDSNNRSQFLESRLSLGAFGAGAQA